VIAVIAGLAPKMLATVNIKGLPQPNESDINNVTQPKIRELIKMAQDNMTTAEKIMVETIMIAARVLIVIQVLLYLKGIS